MFSEKSVIIKDLEVGKKAPVRVETMLKSDLKNRAEVKKEIEKLTDVGCEILRVAVISKDYYDDLKWIVDYSPIPLMADVHFDASMAVMAIEVGFHALRLNPGNMPTHRLKEIVEKASLKRIPIRVGANSGSIAKRHLDSANGDKSLALVEAVSEQVSILESLGFNDIIVSAKSTDVLETIRANEILSERYEYPFHVGITEAGAFNDGIVKSSVGVGIMLNKNIGDTIRVSLSESSFVEVEVGYYILQALGLRNRYPILISCPACSRRRIDVIELVKHIKPYLKKLPAGIKVAVMGCEVNGPKEASDADLGIAGAMGGVVIFKKGKIIKKIPFSDIKEYLSLVISEVTDREDV